MSPAPAAAMPDDRPDRDSRRDPTTQRAVDGSGNTGGEEEHIGPYRLLRCIGEGAMGEVWEAEQRAPVRRHVALKIIKKGLDTRSVIARFDAERQALALMDHPAIARVYDAGETPTGRPYFVMELVAGHPITRYADAGRLGLEERLELLCAVCEAVQHAHQKAIIHRDLKPSNILVTELEGRPQPRIIDFGIAKATTQRLTDLTMYTQHGAILGTPGYMSPEQILFAGEDVDTRTDVYALGVVMYELLTGAQPVDLEVVTTEGLDALRRSLLKDDPQRPSTRLRTLADAGEAVSAARGLTAQQLRRALAGDLDWIVMKALEKERRRRYASPSELAADIRRYLAHEPVQARPPSLPYQTGKFVRRHRAAVAVTAVIAVALIGGIVSTSLALLRARQAEAEALAQAARADREAVAAREVAAFLEELFEVAAPDRSYGETVTASELLDRGARRIRDELSAQPLLQARLERTIGGVYASLALHEQALTLARDAVAKHRAAGDARELASSLTTLGRVQRLAADFADAEASLQEALAMRRSLPGDVDADVAETLHELGTLRYTTGDHELADELLRRAVSLFAAVDPPRPLALAEALTTLGDNLFAMKRPEDARPAFERALAIYRDSVGERHPGVAANLNNLGVISARADEHERALAFYDQALAANRAIYGTSHPEVATVLANKAISLDHVGRLDEAEAAHYEGLRIREATLGPDHVRVAASLTDLSVFYARHDRPRDAMPLLERILALRSAALGADHPRIAQALTFKASLHTTLAEYDTAAELLTRARETMSAARGPEHRDMLPMLRESARLMRATGREGEAAQYDAGIAAIEAATTR